MSDGSLHFPKRGDPPEVIEGYQRDPDNVYILRPLLDHCVYRSLHIMTNDCNCKEQQYLACERGYVVSSEECAMCAKTGRRDQLLSPAVA